MGTPFAASANRNNVWFGSLARFLVNECELPKATASSMKLLVRGRKINDAEVDQVYEDLHATVINLKTSNVFTDAIANELTAFVEYLDSGDQPARVDALIALADNVSTVVRMNRDAQIRDPVLG